MKRALNCRARWLVLEKPQRRGLLQQQARYGRVQQLQRMQMEKAFGVPGKVFQHVDGALAWLGNEVFAPAGLEMPAVQMPGG